MDIQEGLFGEPSGKKEEVKRLIQINTIEVHCIHEENVIL
jgi:hypothetical protein